MIHHSALSEDHQHQSWYAYYECASKWCQSQLICVFSSSIVEVLPGSDSWCHQTVKKGKSIILHNLIQLVGVLATLEDKTSRCRLSILLLLLKVILIVIVHVDPVENLKYVKKTLFSKKEQEHLILAMFPNPKIRSTICTTWECIVENCKENEWDCDWLHMRQKTSLPVGIQCRIGSLL